MGRHETDNACACAGAAHLEVLHGVPQRVFVAELDGAQHFAEHLLCFDKHALDAVKVLAAKERHLHAGRLAGHLQRDFLRRPVKPCELRNRKRTCVVPATVP